MLYKKTLKYIFIISCAIAIIFPLVNIHIIFPSFRHLLVENTEEEAVSLAKSLSSIVISDHNQLKSPDEFKKSIEEAKVNFNLEKLKVFSANGKIIYSTTQNDIGKINEKSYFYEIVAKGDVYTNVVQTGRKTLEHRVVDVDVVETYVPIMDGSNFVGAFEIYYDITLRNESLNNVAFNASLISFALVFGFFVLIIIVIFKSERSGNELKIGDLPIIYQSPFYLLLVVIVAIFISEAFVMFFISNLFPRSKLIEIIIDSALLVMIISPFLYFFLLNPLTLHIIKRERAEEELRKSHNELEARITERTAELTEKNKQLGQEISERKQIEEEREKLILELKEAIVKVKTLRGLLPICSSCNKIRDEKGNWINVDVYISDHSEAELTHGYCPECEKKCFPQNFQREN